MAERRVSRDEITPEVLRSLLAYDPISGALVWRVGPRAGRRAGTRKAAYLRVSYKGINIFAHRAAWAIYHGKWPEGVVDHINCVGTDNRIENLRDVSLLENARNKLPRSQAARLRRAQE